METMSKDHTYYKCQCNKPGCQFCDGGLGACTVCGGFEGTLTTDCCGRMITELEEDRIYKQGNLDYRDGDWWNSSSLGSASHFDVMPFVPEPGETSIIHCKRDQYDILIDRTTKWGNPFVLDQDGDRMQVIQKHMNWLVQQKDLLHDLESLRGKKLGCWCGNEKPCHGNNFIYLLYGKWQ